MVTIEQANKIDAILALFRKMKNITSQEIEKELEIDADEAEFLIKFLANEIYYNGDSIVNSIYGGKTAPFILYPNYNTFRFIDSGGCVKWFNEQMNIQKQIAEKENLEITNLKLAIQNSKSSKKISVISLIIAGLALLWAIFGDRLYIILFGV
ncbi:MAG TPA: hypothetical protein DER09_08085 [Prolixibacteraceae bacterium]|nr:hypothetical protein [Prolixibacteraceae bacterium]